MTGIRNGGFAHQDVLQQPQRHAEGCQAEAPVEAILLPEPTGEQRAKEGTNIDTDIEDGKAGVAARSFPGVELAENHLSVSFHTTRANCDGHRNR